MSTVKALEPGSRYDLRVGISPDAPDEDKVRDEVGSFGYCHSYETSSRYDGPGRVHHLVHGEDSWLGPARGEVETAAWLGEYSSRAGCP